MPFEMGHGNQRIRLNDFGSDVNRLKPLAVDRYGRFASPPESVGNYERRIHHCISKPIHDRSG